MIKKTFTITPESGSNNGSISINAKANTDINAVQETIAITGGGINKSINLFQKVMLMFILIGLNELILTGVLKVILYFLMSFMVKVLQHNL